MLSIKGFYLTLEIKPGESCVIASWRDQWRNIFQDYLDRYRLSKSNQISDANAHIDGDGCVTHTKDLSRFTDKLEIEFIPILLGIILCSGDGNWADLIMVLQVDVTII